MGERIDYKEHERNSLLWWLHTVCLCKTQRPAHLKEVKFIEYKLHLNKPNLRDREKEKTTNAIYRMCLDSNSNKQLQKYIFLKQIRKSNCGLGTSCNQEVIFHFVSEIMISQLCIF